MFKHIDSLIAKFNQAHPILTLGIVSVLFLLLNLLFFVIIVCKGKRKDTLGGGDYFDYTGGAG